MQRGSAYHPSSARGLDSKSILDSICIVDSADSLIVRFCVFSFFRISSDSVIVSESKWLDSVKALESKFALVSPNSAYLGSVLAHFSESALDSVLVTESI